MRAITVSDYGNEPVLTDLPKPNPGPGQVLIKVLAAGVNPMDRKIAAGLWKERVPARFPMVLGADVAGVVDATGPDETTFEQGDEVFGQVMGVPLGSTGTYADYVAVAATAPLVRVPRGLDAAVAAALPTAGVTALEIADTLAPLQGKIVLIIGAAGGVGSFLSQLAVSSGAHVIATGRESDAERLRAYGVDEVIDYTRDDVIAAVTRSHPDGIDVLVDLVDEAPEFAATARLVRRGGTAVTTVYVADTTALEAAGIKGINFQLRMGTDALRRLADAVVSGAIVPPPITQIKLDDVPAAMAEPVRDVDGKTVITP